MTKRSNTKNPVGKSSEYAAVPDLADFYTMAYRILQRLPAAIQPYTKNIIVRIENFPDELTLNSLKLTNKYDLLGLYRGVPLPLKMSVQGSNLPDVIFLYRCPLIRFSVENQEKTEDLVNHVMIHEIGHHFGYSDDAMELIEKGLNGGHNRD